MYTSPDPGATIKISDFGLAKVISNTLMTTACGTPGYVGMNNKFHIILFIKNSAPEIIRGKGYDFQIDYWSIGVILYVL